MEKQPRYYNPNGLPLAKSDDELHTIFAAFIEYLTRDVAITRQGFLQSLE